MTTARIFAGFAAGVIASTALWAVAAPGRLRAYDTFAQALALVRDRYATPVEEDVLLRDAIAGMVQARDAHSVYLPPARLARAIEDTEGELADVGLELGPPPPHGELAPPHATAPVVAAVVDGGPAALAGVVVGDRVLAIDGQPPPADASAVKAWQRRLRGSAGARVTISIGRVGWRRPRELVLVRTSRRVASVRLTRHHELGVLAISSFAERTAHETRLALAEAGQAGVAALILDLRGNLGGVVDQALAVADLFLDSGTLVTFVDRTGRQRRDAHPGGYLGPLVVLVDGSTASAAELVAAALSENQRAKLVGAPTYGKGTVQTYLPLDHGGALRLTTGWYLTPAGNRLESNGIQPDVKVLDEKWKALAEPSSGAQTPSARDGNGAKIAPGFDDDPQLVAAIALARSLLPGGGNRGR